VWWSGGSVERARGGFETLYGSADSDRARRGAAAFSGGGMIRRGLSELRTRAAGGWATPGFRTRPVSQTDFSEARARTRKGGQHPDTAHATNGLQRCDSQEDRG